MAELIEIHQTINDPDKKIMVDDTAAGFRDVEEVQETMGGHRYIIKTKKPKEYGHNTHTD